MKGFKDSTKTQRGEFDFSRGSTQVKGYTRSAPSKGAIKVASGGDPMPVPKPRPPVPMKTGGALRGKGRC